MSSIRPPAAFWRSWVLARTGVAHVAGSAPEETCRRMRCPAAKPWPIGHKSNATRQAQARSRLLIAAPSTDAQARSDSATATTRGFRQRLNRNHRPGNHTRAPRVTRASQPQPAGPSRGPEPSTTSTINPQRSRASGGPPVHGQEHPGTHDALTLRLHLRHRLAYRLKVLLHASKAARE